MKYLSILLLSVCMYTFAQQPSHSVSGRVIHSVTRQPLGGVSVYIISNASGTSTDSAGRFFLSDIHFPDTLVFSHVGFKGQRLPVRQAQNLVIVLQPDGQTLEEVVISNGYESIPKERITGSVVQIDNAMLNRNTGSNILNRLEGLTSGLLVDRRVQGSELANIDANNITIRGISTITEGIKAPLVVLDNFPYEGDINNINPNDIENITVLRDAASASIWGAKAANGVIIITTKKGRFNQPTRLSLNSNVTVFGKPDLYHYPQMSSADFIDMEKYLFDLGYYNTYLPFPQYAAFSPAVEILNAARKGALTEEAAAAQLEELKKHDVRDDFLRYIYRNAVNQQYALNLYGGSNNVSYFLSGGYDNSRGQLTQNQYDRKTFNYSLHIRPLKKLDITADGMFAQGNSNNGILGGYGKIELSDMLSSHILYPYARMADENGDPLPIANRYGTAFTDTAGGGLLLDWKYRPLQELTANELSSATQTWLTRIGLAYSVMPGLSIDFKYQYQQENNSGRIYFSKESFYARNMINLFTQLDGNRITYIVPVGGILNQSQSQLHAHALRGQLNFQHTYAGKHRITAIAGGEVRQSQTDASSYASYGYDPNTLLTSPVDYQNSYQKYGGLGKERIPNNSSYSRLLNRFVSGFINASYTFDNRYIVSASARKDASNLFGVATNDKGKPFWSAGFCWNLSNEAFYALDALPSLQLKLSYGFNGNVNNSLSAYTVIQYGTPGNNLTKIPFANILQPADRNLTWENTRTINTGVSFATRNNRIAGSAEAYWKLTTDLINIGIADPTTGVGTVTTFRKNSGNMSAQGLDITLNSRNITGRFSWTTDLLFSYSTFKVTKLEKDDRQPTDKVGTGNSVVSKGTSLIPVIGRSPYALYSYAWGGLDGQTGNPIGFLNGAPSQDARAVLSATTYADLIYHGPALPVYFGSLINTFSFAGLELSVNLQYKLGYYFRKPSLSYYTLYLRSVTSGEYADRWQQPGDEQHTNVPSRINPVSNGYRDNFYTSSEVNVRKGDHIRLQDIRLSYTLKKERLGRFPLQQLQVYAIANNLGMIWCANKEKIDPDYNAVNTDFPPVKSVAVGVKLDF